MPLLAAVIIRNTVLTALHVVWLVMIPIFKDDRVPSWQPLEVAFYCLVIRPDPQCSAAVVNTTSGFQVILVCNDDDVHNIQ